MLMYVGFCRNDFVPLQLLPVTPITIYPDSVYHLYICGYLTVCGAFGHTFRSPY